MGAWLLVGLGTEHYAVAANQAVVCACLVATLLLNRACRPGLAAGLLMAVVQLHTAFSVYLYGFRGEPGRIQIGRATWAHIHERVPCTSRGSIPVKGKGQMETWFID